MVVLVTGANGFVGKRFMDYKPGKYELTPVSLRNTSPADINLSGVDVIVHLAGKAHDMSEQDEKVYFSINYKLTKELADAAKRWGVPHFVYVSTVKVYGEGSDEPLNEQSACHPEDPYGKSKLEAERYLQSIQSPSFTVSIVRPPVVYGPGVKGNMLRLMAALQKKRPLPLDNTRNLRTMVFLDNLIELLHRVIDTRLPGIFVAGDAQPLSTDRLIKLMGEHLGGGARLVSIPGFLRSLMKAVKPGLHKRLFGSFVIDNSDTNKRLNFTPPFTTGYGVEQMAKWFVEVKSEK